MQRKAHQFSGKLWAVQSQRRLHIEPGLVGAAFLAAGAWRPWIAFSEGHCTANPVLSAVVVTTFDTVCHQA
jgi:hypothetical protein